METQAIGEKALVLTTRRSGHDILLGMLVGECKPGQSVGDEVDPQQMDGLEGDGQTHERRQHDCPDLGHVAGHDIADEAPDIVVDASTFADGSNDGREAVVEQDQLGRLLADIGTRDPHGHTDVGGLEGGCIVDAVTRHGH